MKPRSVIAGAIVGLITLCAISALAHSQVAQGAVQQAASTPSNMFCAESIVVDRNGNDLSGADVRLHVMASGGPNEAAKELYNVTLEQPSKLYPGLYVANNLTVPEGSAYGYIDASVKDHGAGLRGRSGNFSIRPAATLVGNIVMGPPGHADKASVAGFIVNSYGQPLAGQMATLHVMGYNATTGMPVELYSRSVKTANQSSSATANPGMFVFNDVRTPRGTSYCYVSSNVTRNGTTYYGHGNNVTLVQNGTATTSLVVKMPVDTFKVQGYVVDTTGTGLSGVNATLHLMGFQGTSDVPKEIRSWMTATSGQPNAGQYVFSMCTPLDDAAYVYVDANVTQNGTAYYARSNNYSVAPNASINASIVLHLPRDTCKVQGYVVDTTGTGLARTNVTLHVMGYNATSMAPKEYGTLKAMAESQPNAGHFAFTLNSIPAGATYCYVSSNVTKNGTTYYGRGDNLSITPNMSANSNIIVHIPQDTCTVHGYVVNGSGIGLPGLNVTLHVMGFNATTSTPGEFYHLTATTAANRTDVGMFTFDRVNIPAGATYTYVDTSVIRNGTTYYGRSNNYSITANANVTESIVLKVPAGA